MQSRARHGQEVRARRLKFRDGVSPGDLLIHSRRSGDHSKGSAEIVLVATPFIAPTGPFMHHQMPNAQMRGMRIQSRVQIVGAGRSTQHAMQCAERPGPAHGAPGRADHFLLPCSQPTHNRRHRTRPERRSDQRL